MQGHNSWSLGIIIFFLLFEISSVSAIGNISLDYPKNASVGVPFNIILETFNFSGVYDVKADVINSSGGRISKIFNGIDWVSTNYYVNGIINSTISNSTILMINITDYYEGEATLNVTLRKTNTSSTYKFGQFLINIFIEDVADNQTANQTNNTNNETENIDINLDYPDEIRYGEDFSVDLEIGGIEREYDVKIAVLDENDKIISKIYDEVEDKWKSSNYYLTGVMEGDDRMKFGLNISEDYEGDAVIEIKIRQNDKIMAEGEYDIEVIKEEKTTKDEGKSIIVNNKSIITESLVDRVENSTIYLGRENEKEEYKSREQKIKEIGIIISPLLLLILTGFLLFNVKKRQREKVL